MALTAQVKDELARLSVDRISCRKAEVSATLRFAGGLHIISGRIVIEAELDTGIAARRLRQAIHEVYGHTSEVIVISGGGLRRGNRYVVRVVKDGESLARQTGLLDNRGRPVRGLPSQVVSGGIGEAEAAWRGAFLAHGSLTEPGRSAALEVTCPGPEAALALVGAARRLGIPAKAREVRGVDRVVIRDGDAISGLLARLGAHDSVLEWENKRTRREVRGTANRLANFDDANLRRSAQIGIVEVGETVGRAAYLTSSALVLPLEHRIVGTEAGKQSRDCVAIPDHDAIHAAHLARLCGDSEPSRCSHQRKRRLWTRRGHLEARGASRFREGAMREEGSAPSGHRVLHR